MPPASSDPGAMLNAVGLGAAGALMLTLATLTTNFVNIYMSSLAWKSLAPRAGDGAVIWSIGIIGTALSAVPGVWLEQYTNFMMLLGALLVPVGGILVAHYYIGRPVLDAAFVDDLYEPVGSVPRRVGCRCRGVGGWRRGLLRVRVDRRDAAGAGGLGPRLSRPAIHSAGMSIGDQSSVLSRRSQTDRRPRLRLRPRLTTETETADCLWPAHRPDRRGGADRRQRAATRAVADACRHARHRHAERGSRSLRSVRGHRRGRYELSRGFRRRRGPARGGGGAGGHQGARRAEPDARVCNPPALGSHAWSGRSDPHAVDSRASDAADACTVRAVCAR